MPWLEFAAMAKYTLYVYKKGPLKGNKEPGIYEDDEGRKYIRPKQANGQRPYLSLGTTSIETAIKMRDTRRVAKLAAKRGIALAPEEAAKKAAVTVAIVVKTYDEAGCPNRKGVARRAGKHLGAESVRCKTLLKYFNTDKPAEDLVQNDIDGYKDWRVAKVIEKEKEAAKRKGIEDYEPDPSAGLRTVDLDLNCLNNAMRWAVRKQLLTANPIGARDRYYTASDATHCREFAPSDANELHTVSGVLMSSRRSETLGWQLLFEGMTGLRTEETVTLRVDARPDEPGGLTSDGGSMCVRRAEKSKKYNNYVQVHEGLKFVMKAHRIWHEQRYPLSPYYFPGRDKKALGHINKSVLTKALDRLYQVYVKFREHELDLKKLPDQPYLTKKYTSHGAGRAFYVLVRRSRGISDSQIAFELNQIGGVSTLEQVYGLPPEHWKNGNAPELSWIPKGEPAWSKIKKVDFSALESKTSLGGEALSFDI